MEEILIWGLALLVCAAIVAHYARGVRRGARRDREERAEAKELGIDQPRAQHPQVDISRCIGCGACVAACPEGGVLGMISGKAAIINGLRCVGHGRCADACPVEAVAIGMGDVARRDDLPSLDADGQSSVPGIYLAGELGGLALIRNAIHQGTLAARAIARELASASGGADDEGGDSSTYDLVIVGAGPAGMSAALEARRLGLNLLLLDQKEAGGTILKYPRKKLVLTQPVEIPSFGWLRKPEYAKEELLEIWQQTLAKSGVELQAGKHVERVERHGGRFLVHAGPTCYSCKKVVLALGRGGTPRRLEVEGEEQAKVLYQLLDAAQFQGEHLLVVGGGDSAIEAAIALGKQSGNHVTLSYRKNKFFRIKRRNADHLAESVKRNEVQVLTQSEVLRIGPDRVWLQTKEGELELPNQYVFVFTGGIPPFEMLKRMGIAFGAREFA